jgi:uracil-DNA glycosylase family 4
MSPVTEPDAGRPAPHPDCALCPRLHAFIAEQRRSEPDWHNAPVASFGPADAPMLLVGLAPGLRGANRTGRPFTGDHAGKVLYPALLRHGLATGLFDERPDDTLAPRIRITNAVRCVPPQNKPTGAEIRTCNRFLEAELTQPPAPRAILALGRIAHEATLRALSLKIRDYPFNHGGIHELETGQTLLSTYHFSRYNMNTGRLTEAMVDAIMEKAVAIIG